MIVYINDVFGSILNVIHHQPPPPPPLSITVCSINHIDFVVHISSDTRYNILNATLLHSQYTCATIYWYDVSSSSCLPLYCYVFPTVFLYMAKEHALRSAMFNIFISMNRFEEASKGIVCVCSIDSYAHSSSTVADLLNVPVSYTLSSLCL